MSEAVVANAIGSEGLARAQRAMECFRLTVSGLTLYDVECRPTRFQLLDIVRWLSRISTAKHKDACAPLPDYVYGDDGVGKYGVVPCTLELGVALMAVPKLAPPPEIPCGLLARATDNGVLGLLLEQQGKAP
jgi:hypothetical protein